MWRLDPKMLSHLLSPEVPLCRQPSGEVVCPVANLWNGGSERLRFKKSKNLSFPKEVSLILEVDRTRFAHAAGLLQIVKPGSLGEKLKHILGSIWYDLCILVLEHLVYSSTASSSFSERLYPVCRAISAITFFGSFFISSNQNMRRFGWSWRFQPGGAKIMCVV